MLSSDWPGPSWPKHGNLGSGSFPVWAFFRASDWVPLDAPPLSLRPAVGREARGGEHDDDDVQRLFSVTRARESRPRFHFVEKAPPPQLLERQLAGGDGQLSSLSESIVRTLCGSTRSTPSLGYNDLEQGGFCCAGPPRSPFPFGSHRSPTSCPTIVRPHSKSI